MKCKNCGKEIYMENSIFGTATYFHTDTKNSLCHTDIVTFAEPERCNQTISIIIDYILTKAQSCTDTCALPKDHKGKHKGYSINWELTDSENNS